MEYRQIKDRLTAAIVPHVTFDGWSAASFAVACEEAGIDPVQARAVCPNGALDLAAHAHSQGDQAMRAAMADLGEMRVRDRVSFAVRRRIELAGDKEVVRRATTLFALPQNAAKGAALIWGTADAIWDVLGDTSDDVNWYSKRAILSGVYSSVVLFWLGDDSPDHAATWAFLDRRIEDVMRFEAAKAQAQANPVLKGLFAGPAWLLSGIKAPSREVRTDLPGRWNGHK